jgi:hypothetical protein
MAWTASALRRAANDIIQAILFGEREKLIAFCQAIQAIRLWTAKPRPNLGICPLSDPVIMAEARRVRPLPIELTRTRPSRPYIDTAGHADLRASEKTAGRRAENVAKGQHLKLRNSATTFGQHDPPRRINRLHEIVFACSRTRFFSK